MMKEFLSNSHLFGANAPFIEELYETYLVDPSSVGAEWRDYFDELSKTAGVIAKDVAHAPVIKAFADLAKQNPLDIRRSQAAAAPAMDKKQVSVLQLINAYRFLGCRHAALDPLQLHDRHIVPELDPAYHGLGKDDMETVFNTGSLVGPAHSTLREILNALNNTYCCSIGVEYMYITETEQKRWIQNRFEGIHSKPNFDNPTKKALLEQLTAAETLEKYLHTRFVGQKRFSLEGGESIIPALDEVIQRAGAQGVKEVVIGMAHRGRLNILVNNLGKLPKDLFLEFEGKHAVELMSGDVKYHQGFSSDVKTQGGPLHLTLAFNPSHLEIVNPVVEGSVRARQQRRADKDGKQVLPILIHGDAAFAGQGVVMETLNLSQTRGYGTGGTIHIVVNNQIGFTTSDPRDSRSTIYCTDVAKMVEIPVFHVNGDDPEAVLMVVQAALDYRMKFGKDVVVDIICFRKLGHNEQDEPMVTQPLMYKKIAAHPGTRKLYTDKLVAEGVVAAHEPEDMIKNYRAALDAGQSTNPRILYGIRPALAIDWAPYMKVEWRHPADTKVPLDDLRFLAEKLTTFPPDFKLHPTVEKMISSRKQMGEGKLPLDWGMAENLAYASLLKNGYGVRISGQDCGRGTFAHRHAVFHDQNRQRWDSGDYIPLRSITSDQGKITVIDSILSEEAVLAFEYGYASAQPFEFVVWEAQFGDFANGAQVVMDQFISSGEAKWGRLCGLVMFLPHGYEGQGPEHSSARLERYLQLCAEYNIQVCVPSTPAQIFHMIRRQMVRPYRKPLVVMMPKSLLRRKESTSSLEELANGSFKCVIGEVENIDSKKVKRVIFCSGKVYFDLIAERKARNIDNIAVVRIEQLYPFPHEDVMEQINLYPNAKSVLWAQEEPGNQGAWHRIQHYLLRHLKDDQKLHYAFRPSAASPAVGYLAAHNEQTKALLNAALTIK